MEAKLIVNVCELCGYCDLSSEREKKTGGVFLLKDLQGGDRDKRGMDKELKISLENEDSLICGRCKTLVSSAVSSKNELEKTEREVRRRQMELLRELRKLEGQVKVFKMWIEEIRVVTAKTSNSAKGAKQERNDKQFGIFRKKIMKVVEDLQIFHGDISLAGHEYRRIWDGDMGMCDTKIKAEPQFEVESDLDPGDNFFEGTHQNPSPKSELRKPNKNKKLDSDFEDSSSAAEDTDEDSNDDPDVNEDLQQASESIDPAAECPVCGKPFKDGYVRRSHRITHLNELEKHEEETAYNQRKSKPTTLECPT